MPELLQYGHFSRLEVNGQQVIADVAPLAPETPAGTGGMVLTVQPSKRIQEMESAIRTRLHKKCFRARHRFSDIVRASRPLGVHRNTLKRWMKKPER